MLQIGAGGVELLTGASLARLSKVTPSSRGIVESDAGPSNVSVGNGKSQVPDKMRGASDVGHQYAADIAEGGTGKAFAGHGEYEIWNKTPAIVPEGTSITMWTGHGKGLPDLIGKTVEAGDYDKVIKLAQSNEKVMEKLSGAVTYLPGAEVTNYVLKAPKNLNIHKNSITVEDRTYLSDLLKPNQGCLDWAACRLPEKY